MTVGDTNTILGIYRLLAVLRALEGWIEGDFARWMDELVDDAWGKLMSTR